MLLTYGFYGGARGVMVIVVENGHGEFKSWTRLIAQLHKVN